MHRINLRIRMSSYPSPPTAFSPLLRALFQTTTNNNNSNNNNNNNNDDSNNNNSDNNKLYKFNKFNVLNNSMFNNNNNNNRTLGGWPRARTGELALRADLPPARSI